jgi:hypothetical protein
MDIYPIFFVKHFTSIVTVSEQQKARPGSTAAHKLIFCVTHVFMMRILVTSRYVCFYSILYPDTGRIYKRIFISYPISKNLQKGYFLFFFGAGYFEDIISYSGVWV